MSALRYYPIDQEATHQLFFSSKETQSSVRLRISLTALIGYSEEAIVLPLISKYKVAVNVLKTVLTANHQLKQIDLELVGAIEPINKALNHLESLKLAIQGKPNVDGDSWYY